MTVNCCNKKTRRWESTEDLFQLLDVDLDDCRELLRGPQGRDGEDGDNGGGGGADLGPEGDVDEGKPRFVPFQADEGIFLFVLRETNKEIVFRWAIFFSGISGFTILGGGPI